MVKQKRITDYFKVVKKQKKFMDLTNIQKNGIV